MSVPASSSPLSPLALSWIGLSLLLGLLLYLGFIFQPELLEAGGIVWGFLRWLFSGVI